MPVTGQSRHVDKHRDVATHWQIRIMSQIEQQELKQRIEQAAQSVPTSFYTWLRRLLLAIVIVVPLGGATLLILGPRSGQSQVAT